MCCNFRFLSSSKNNNSDHKQVPRNLIQVRFSPKKFHFHALLISGASSGLGTETSVHEFLHFVGSMYLCLLGIRRQEDLNELVGDVEYRFGKWKGSTRLLLLDEKHAYKAFDEMPDPIKGLITKERGCIDSAVAPFTKDIGPP
ncbi:unnamed protein product [Lactuca virosa]|uniref:Uncharacterized protein n=1 Tax=Lactuca virosa TaxID=75947 RepID=A0AAU9L975_9ASTR|nr:unnamed protein product [Lactuca virosa]